MENTALINIDYSMWSGRVKLDSPPKELVSAGHIKIFDIDKLNLFRNYKTRAFGLADAVGIRFMQGWLVSADSLPALEESLSDVHSAWANDLARFVQDYPKQAAAYAASCGKWAGFVRSKQPAPDELWKRFVFEWQTFRLTPELTHAVSKGNKTEALVENIPVMAMQSIIESLQTLYKDSFDKENPSGKAYGALARISARAEALSFANPLASKLAPMLASVAERRDPALARQALAKMDSIEGVQGIISNGLPAPQATQSDPLLAQAEALLVSSSDFLDSLELY